VAGESIGKLSIDLELADEQFKAAVKSAQKDVVEFGRVAEAANEATAQSVKDTDAAWQSLSKVQAEALRSVIASEKASQSLAAQLGVTETQLKKSEKATRDLAAAEVAETAAAMAAAKAAESEAKAEAERIAVLNRIPTSIREGAAALNAAETAAKANASALGVSISRYLALESAEKAAAAAASDLAAKEKAQAAQLATLTPALQRAAAASSAVTTASKATAQAHVAEAAAGAQATAQADSAKVSYGNLGAQLADIGKGLASGVSPLTIATQQGDQLVGALAQMGTTGMVVAGVLAGLTATVLAGMTAWKAYYEEENAAIEVAVAHREAQDDLQVVLDDTKATLLQIKVETKAITDLQADLQTNSVNAMEAYATATEKTRGRLAALHAEEQSTTGQIERTYADAAETVQDYFGAWIPGTYIVDAWTTSTSEAAAETEALTADLGKAAEKVKENRQAHDELATAQDEAAKASKRHKAAIDEEKKALDAWNASLKAENDTAEKNAKTYRDALDAIDKMSFGLKKNKTDVENISDAYHDSLASIKASETEALAVVSGNADAEATVKKAALLKSIEAQDAYYRDVEALRQKSQADAEQAALDRIKLEQATQKKQTDIYEKGEKDRQEIQVSYLSAAASMAGSFAEAFGLLQQNMTGISKKEALVLFRVQQALQLAQALILAPAAVLQGLAQAGPAGGIAAGIAAGVEVAAIATAKPPEFHTGGVISALHQSQSPGPNAGEVAMVGQVGEGFLTAPVVEMLGGADGLAALERMADAGAGSAPSYSGFRASATIASSSSSPSGGSMPRASSSSPAGSPVEAPQTVLKIGNRAFNAMVTKALNNPGPLRDATVGTGPRRVSPYAGKV